MTAPHYSFRTLRPAIRLSAVAILAVAAALAGGCKKQRSNLTIKKLQEVANEAQRHEAEKFAATEYNQLLQQLDQARQNFNGQNFDMAFQVSRDALNAAETMLENVKRDRAAALQNQAEQDIGVAQDNNGPASDADRYNAIVDANAKGREEYSKNDWDKAIVQFEKVMENVNLLLAPMKNNAETRLVTIQNRNGEMEREGVRIHAVEIGVEVDQLLAEAGRLITEERRYTTAETVLNQANQKVDEAIDRAKEVRSQIAVNKIETDLLQAMAKGARIYFPEQLAGQAEAYENITRDLRLLKWDNVLQAADLLIPKAEELRFNSMQRSAESKADSLQQAIDELIEGGAPEHLPGRVEVLQARLDDARAQIQQGAAARTEEAFTESEIISEAALAEYEKYQQEFYDLASDYITRANVQLQIAIEVFGATDRIFDQPAPGDAISDLERQFEANKQAMKQEIGGMLEYARQTLESAQLLRDSDRPRFSQAIQLAEEVESASKIIQEETYRVAAHNSILEIASRLNYLAVRQGAAQYVPQDLDEAHRRLELARETLQSGQPKDAVDRAAEAKAQMEVVRQKLASLATERIEGARSAIEEALDENALKFAAENMESARRNLEAALSGRDGYEYREIIERSLEADALAKAAKDAAQRQTAELQIQEAETSVMIAAKSDADIFAPRLYKEAADKLAAAKRMLESGDLVEAARLAGESAKLGRDAAYERVIEAESRLANASLYNAWDFDPRTLAEAINNAKEARRLADIGEFDASRQAADQAILLSDTAEVAAKSGDVAQRVAQLNEGVRDSVDAGASYFQPAEVKELIDAIARVETEYEPENYEAAAAELRELEARLEEVMVSTPAVLERAVAQQTARREHFLEAPIDLDKIAEGPLEESEKALRYARIDFDKGEYRGAYTNLRNGMRLLDGIQSLVDTSQYNEKVGELFGDFMDAQETFRQVLSIPETMMIQLAISTPGGRPQAVAVAGGAGPIRFRESVDDLYKRAKAIEPPALKTTIHDSVLELFRQAQMAAHNFEQLVILDQYDKEAARTIIRSAYSQLARAKSMQQDVQETFRNPDADNKVVRLRKALGVELY